MIARCQLLTAIDLHFEDKDAVSIHTLAGAASEIIESLCRSIAIKPMTEDIRCMFPEKTCQEIWKIRNLYRNAFKHADRSDADVIAQFKEVTNDYMIYVGVADYLRLRKASPVPMQVFHTWFSAVHEDRLSSAVNKQPYRDKFPGIRSMSRVDQKRMGKEAIASYLADPQLLRDPRTEAMILPE